MEESGSGAEDASAGGAGARGDRRRPAQAAEGTVLRFLIHLFSFRVSLLGDAKRIKKIDVI